MAKPVDTMEWASDAGAQKTEPSESYKDAGWVAGDPAPAHYMNWWMNNADAWRSYFETTTDTNITNIATNVTDIATNATDIATNAADILTKVDSTYFLPTPSTGAFELIGSQLNIASVTSPILVSLGINRVVLSRADTKVLQAYDFDGLVWATVGGTITNGTAGNGAMAAMSSSRVMFADNTDFKVEAFDFDGTTWSSVGTGLTITGITNIRSACALSSSRVVISGDDGSGNMDIQVFDFNGSTWTKIGTTFELTGANGSQICALDSTSIAYIDTGNDSLRKYTFNGTTWSIVGSGLTITISNQLKLASLTASTIAVHNQDIDELREYSFDGSNWAEVGTALSLATTGSPGLCGLGSARVAMFYPDATLGLRFYGKPKQYIP